MLDALPTIALCLFILFVIKSWEKGNMPCPKKKKGKKR